MFEDFYTSLEPSNKKRLNYPHFIKNSQQSFYVLKQNKQEQYQ